MSTPVRYALLQLKSINPQKFGSGGRIFVIKCSTPHQLAPEKFGENVFSFSMQLVEKVASVGFYIGMDSLQPLFPPDDAAQEELRKIIEGFPPTVIEQFMITL